MKVAVVLLLFVLFAQASHFRYGTLTFSKSTTNPKEITFTANLAMRRGFFGAPNQGSNLGAVGNFICNGVTGYMSSDFIATNVDAANDIVYATTTYRVTFPNARTNYCFFTSNARISNLNNNANGYFDFGATVVLTQAEIDTKIVNNSPVSGLLPVVSVPFGVVPYSYQIVATDNENDALSFRQSTYSEMSGSQPSGSSCSSSGLVTLSAQLAQGFWSTQQTIIDAFGNTVAVDYLLNVAPIKGYCSGNCGSLACASNISCASCGSCLPALPRIVQSDLNSGNRPRTNLPAPASGSSITVSVGSTEVVSFVADDENLPYGTVIRMGTSGLPNYATPSAQTSCSGSSCTYVGDYSNPQLLQVTFRPTQANAGTSATICVGVTSNGNALPYSQHCVNIVVPAAPVQVCGNGIVEGTEQCDGGDCCTSSCQFAGQSTTCRASGGDCDAAETCTGSSSVCPADSKVASGSVCRASGGDCDIAESCDGVSDSCPADNKVASGTQCRAANGKCDVAESCDGVNNNCPADAPSNTPSCFCERQGQDKPTVDYFCSPIANSTAFYQCAYGAWAAQSSQMGCAPGTECGCAPGVECSCGGTQSPCVFAGQKQVCNN